MVRPALRPASKTAAALAALVAAAALAGCEDKPYPSPAHEATVAAPAPTELAGAPTDAAPAPEGAPPAPTPPPMDVASAPPPPPGYDEPAAAPPPPPRPAGDATVVYDLGPVVGPDRKAAPPPPPPPAPAHAARRSHPAPTYAPPPVHRVGPRPHAAAALAAPAKPALRPAAPAHPAATHPAAATSVRGPLAPQHAAPAAAAAAAVKPAPTQPVESAPVAPPKHERRSHRHGHATAPANATDVGDHAAHLAALQTALSDAVSAKAVLRSPGDLPAGRAADVTLTLPADFAETVRAAAQKEGLADAAASVNLTARLAGDGYTVEPDAAQSQPLTLGQPTEFHWTATANPGSKDALHADVGADLLGGGAEKEALSLGSVQASAAPSRIGPRLVGAGILGLIVVAVLAWLSRGRGLTPAQQASARRAAERRRNGIHAVRPLDMTPDGAAPPTPPRDEPRI